jgi:hypothetical protein
MDGERPQEILGAIAVAHAETAAATVRSGAAPGPLNLCTT